MLSQMGAMLSDLQQSRMESDIRFMSNATTRGRKFPRRKSRASKGVIKILQRRITEFIEND